MKKGLLLILAILSNGLTVICQNTSAILDLESTSQGFLPPVMAKIQMIAIASPAEGLTVYCKDCEIKGLYFFDGLEWIGPKNIRTNDVYNPITGRIWLDRNLGASQVATSSTDTDSYGDLYQWGRGTDGHQERTSNSIAILSDSDMPAHAAFIRTTASNFGDWRSPQNDNLWQGVNGVNNPCPTGYRLPTDSEWDEERLSWSTNDSTGAFASALKLVSAGNRSPSSADLPNVGTSGFYWSGTIIGTNSRRIFFDSSNSSVGSALRGNGGSVRCIRN